jgi:hypothetical protein
MQNDDKIREINVLRSDLAAIAVEFSLLKLIWLLRKFEPDQPRAPAGRPDGGQWIGGAIASPDGDARPTRVASGRPRAQCKLQYERDLVQCRLARLAACYAQAMVRLVACERGDRIPALIY